ncbi:hypothetical protein [Asticcacaulis taihuensis]|jgi:hypothetical protein|uniref:hypothetical protein n=1 Tax=Asticcacaulis taihuensis TaxID=260084 RepID=UPI0026EB7DF3|nr:hypothetical protein [Asticcacaulis taihuensis]
MRFSIAIWGLVLMGCSAHPSDSQAPNSVAAAFIPEPAPQMPAPKKTICPKAPSSNDLAMLVAGSPAIVIGQLGGDPARILSIQHDYLTLPVNGVEWIKGSAPPAPLTVRVYLEKNTEPSADAIAAAIGKNNLLFLLRSDGEGEQRYYFSRGRSGALRAADQAGIALVRTEIARQNKIVADWAPDDTLPDYAKVQNLIQQLAAISPNDVDRQKKQQAIFDKIEALGKPAVPALIALMDDRRELADHYMRLMNNFPGAFEAYRWYGPEKIVDALSAILNQITGTGFTSIYNGGTEAERDTDVAGWRIYASGLVCGQT